MWAKRCQGLFSYSSVHNRAARGCNGRIGCPDDVGRYKKALYERVLERIEADLREHECFGMLFINGDGNDTSYRDVHRQLPRSSRRIFEDPIAQDSKVSQLIQMADLVAWCANALLYPHPRNAFVHEWYTVYLASRDVRRAPLRINLEHS